MRLRATRAAGWGVGLVALIASLVGCGGGDSSGWKKTGSAVNPFQGIWCNAEIAGAVRHDSDGDQWRCERPNGVWKWFEYQFQPGNAATQRVMSAATGPRISAQPGSSILVLNAAGISTWELTLGDTATPPALPMVVGTDGKLTVNPTSFVSAQQSVCQTDANGVQQCIGLTVHGVGPVSPVMIDPAAGTVTFPFGFRVDIAALSGYAGLPAGCAFGPVTATLAAHNYDPGTGTATLLALGRPLAAASGCGDYNDLFNNVLGLPGTVDLVLIVKIDR
jgi:hypothetical protein